MSTTDIHPGRPRILFTSSMMTSFIRQDLELLNRHFDVEHLLTRGIGAPLRIVLRSGNADTTFTWFASTYSFVAVLAAKWRRKPAIIVVGGVDASKHTEIKYGIWLSPWKSLLVRWAMRNAHKLLVVDRFFEGEIKRLAEYEGTNIEYVPTGYDSTRWTPGGKKQDIVLTVAACDNAWRMQAKGIDVLFTVARESPDIRFVVVGIGPAIFEDLRSRAPENVEIAPFVEQEGLLSYYQRAKVYFQPSYTEGLPNSVCEAMLCECVPVGTHVGGIPTAVGDAGFLASRGDVTGLSRAIRDAFRSAPDTGMKAREHIRTTFPLERREQALVRILTDAIG